MSNFKKLARSIWLRAHLISFWVLIFGLVVMHLPDVAMLASWDMGKAAAACRLIGLVKVVLGALEQPEFGQVMSRYINHVQGEVTEIAEIQAATPTVVVEPTPDMPEQKGQP